MTILLFVLLLGGLVAACGGTNDSAAPPASDVGAADAPTSTTTAPVPDIVISNFTFTVRGPVRPGQQVTVVNNDESSHSVESDAGNAFDIRVSGGGGTTMFIAPKTAGTYAFHCKYHANMNGSLTVE